jgi:O-antigen/teichoic acid export membrane protein
MDKKILRWNYIFQYGYVFTNIFNSIILLPLYVMFINAETLGVWLATGNILAWLTMADPGIGDVLQQKVAELNGSKSFKELSLTIGSGILASAFVLVAALLIGIGFYFSLDVLLNKNLSNYPQLPMAFLISIISSGITLVSFAFSGINQGLHLSKQVAISYIVSNLLFLGLNVLFLYLGYSLLSIAIANLGRAMFLMIYNVVFVVKYNRAESVTFSRSHFKKFIKIFSYTSFSKIFLAFANNIDLLILARYIPARFITLFEINRRPIKMTQGLVGRYSVALMPMISYAKGKNDMEQTKQFINKRLKVYIHITTLLGFLFCLTYRDVIHVWVGAENYAGAVVTYLLVLIFVSYCLGYFLMNIGYALGDFKVNSVYSIVKCTLIILFTIIAARYWGINGVLLSTLFVTLITDVAFYTRRLVNMKYIMPGLLKSIARVWAVLLPVSLLYVALSNKYAYLFSTKASTVFHAISVSLLYFFIWGTIIYITDKEMQTGIVKIKTKISNRLRLKFNL